MDKTLAVLNMFCGNWQQNINLGKEYNTTVSIGFDDTVFETLSCIENGLRGTGSFSHGYDHTDKSETKGLSWVQPKKCKKCNSKIHFFSEKCGCGSFEFEYINDSRWGIDVNAHFKYQVGDYYLWFLLPDKFDFNCRIFYLKQFRINSNNLFFQKILEIQRDRGKSKIKNLIPYSSDFYVCKPKEISSFKISINDTYGTLVERLLTDETIYNKVIIKKMSKIINLDLLTNKDIYQYEELIPLINLESKKTTHGKNRGVTTRRTQ
jgi:hypothetical protein